MTRIKGIHTMVSLLMVLVVVSCTKYDNPPPYFEVLNKPKILQKKVLLISIDGMSSEVFKENTSPNLTALKANSKYALDFTDDGELNNSVSGWFTMLTGVSYVNHEVSDSTFAPEPPSADDPHANVKVFRNIFEYISEEKDIKTAFVTPWDELRNYMRYADHTPDVSSDEAVKDSTLNILKVFDIGVVAVNFKGIEEAGKNGGYTLQNPELTGALTEIDLYIGEIVDSLKARKNYENEDWLIMVTSNHGGSDENTEPGFLMLHHSALKEYELKVRGVQTVYFNKDDIHAEIKDVNGLYSPGADKDFTVQGDFLFETSGKYPRFFAYGNGVSHSRGWTMMIKEGSWRVNFNGNGSEVTLGYPKIGGSWHNIAFSVKTEGSKRMARIYTDGVLDTEEDVSGKGNMDVTNGKLWLGLYPSSYVQTNSFKMYAANLKYYNLALSQTEISDNVTRQDVTTDPKYDNLIGFWPLTDGAGRFFQNKAKVGGPAWELTGPYKWVSLGNNVPKTEAPLPFGEYSTKALQADVGTTLLNWVGLSIKKEYKMDGKEILKQFEAEFQGLI